MKQEIKLSLIRIDGGTQPRVKIDTAIVDDYADRIKAGDDFPPLDLVFDGTEYWLSDGFHRYHGYAKLGRAKVDCEVRKGTVRDAILHSCGANGHHGLRRTNADKRKAVETLLNDAEWGKWSAHKVADAAGVSVNFVSELRIQVSSDDTSNSKKLGKDGKLHPARKAVARPEAGGADKGEKSPEIQQPGAGKDAGRATKAAKEKRPAPDNPVEREPGDDTDEIEREKKEEAERRKKAKANGKEVVNGRHYKAASKDLDSVVRWSDKLNCHAQCEPHLDAVREIFDNYARPL